jgi:hypothetical protein
VVLAKYNELVMKCLWKLTKAIPQFVDGNQLRVDVLLLDIDAFLQAAPPAEWKRRMAANPNPKVDLPLRTIKTILFELVNTLGGAIYERAAMIPPGSPIFVYLKSMVEGGSKSRPESRASLADMTGAAGGAGGEAYAHPGHARQEGQHLEPEMNGIFDKILNKELTKVGIEDLFHFIHAHPEMEGAVEGRIQKSGTYFQGYIRRGLAALTEAQEGAHRPYAPPRQLGDYARTALGSATPLGGSLVASGGLGGSAEAHESVNYHNALTSLQREFGMKRVPEQGGQGSATTSKAQQQQSAAAAPSHPRGLGSADASSTDLHGSHLAMVGGGGACWVARAGHLACRLLG